MGTSKNSHSVPASQMKASRRNVSHVMRSVRSAIFRDVLMDAWLMLFFPVSLGGGRETLKICHACDPIG